MLGASILGICVALVSCQEQSPFVRPNEFQTWFKAAAAGELKVPKPAAKRAATFRYVFIGGFQGEHMSGYFAQNAKELKRCGVSKRSIHYVLPASDKSVEENKAFVKQELKTISEQGEERLVVVAHSRGACDALAFALDNPEFVRDHVQVFFLVQGPFGGSALADYVLGEGAAMDRRMPAVQRLLAHALGKLEKGLINNGWHGGISGLARQESRAYWKAALEGKEDAVEVVSPKIFYIESAAKPSRLRMFQRALAWYLTVYYGPSDGVVALGDQTLEGVGASLGVFEAGHADLTRRFPASRAGSALGER